MDNANLKSAAYLLALALVCLLAAIDELFHLLNLDALTFHYCQWIIPILVDELDRNEFTEERV